jgi:hypothetical protein
MHLNALCDFSFIVSMADNFISNASLTTPRMSWTSLALAFSHSQQNKVVITLRSDFLGEVGSYRDLNDEVQNHLENVPPMDMDELRRAMEGQAGVVGLRFEADLSQQILDDVEGEPGAMPLLQHALWELWNRRHGRNLRASEYRDFGGVKQAITSTAEKVYADCSKPEQDQVRDIFLRLTRLDEGDEGRDTRRRVPLGDLIPSGADAASITLLLNKLAHARLIVKTVNEDKTELEVAHEALIRYWERLRNWAQENRRFLVWRQKISDKCIDWQKTKGELLQGPYLIEAENWFLEQGHLLSTEEKTYIEESIAHKALRLKLLSNMNKGVLILYSVIAIFTVVIGGYVATLIISISLTERLANQLLEAGRVVSDTVARQEIRHVTAARLIGYTKGIADALDKEDGETALALAEPTFAGLGFDNLILISPQGNELVYLLMDENGNLQREERNTGIAGSSIVQPFLQDKDPEALPLRALGENRVDQKTYYYTAIPVALDGQFHGVVVIGTSIDKFLPLLKATSLADVVLYGADGKVIASTLGGVPQDALVPLSMTKEEYQQSLMGQDIMRGKNNITVLGRSYNIARGRLQVGNALIGVFAVALPSAFIDNRALTSRLIYAGLFTLIILFLIVTGVAVWKFLINPIYSIEKAGQDLKNTLKIDKHEWVKSALKWLVLMLPAGIFLLMISGQIASRLAPQWTMNAGIGSNLDPNQLPEQQSVPVQPVLPSILTPQGWMDTFLTPGIGSGDQIVFPPFILLEHSVTPTSTASPTPTPTHNALSTLLPTTMITPVTSESP